jgi:hypothetical protein
MYVIILTRKEIIITIWPNRDANDHRLIITRDAGSPKLNDQDDLFFDRSDNYGALDL